MSTTKTVNKKVNYFMTLPFIPDIDEFLKYFTGKTYGNYENVSIINDFDVCHLEFTSNASSMNISILLREYFRKSKVNVNENAIKATELYLKKAISDINLNLI